MRNAIVASVFVCLLGVTIHGQTLALYKTDSSGKTVRQLLVPVDESRKRMMESLLGRELIARTNFSDPVAVSALSTRLRDSIRLIRAGGTPTGLTPGAASEARASVGGVLTAGATILALKELQNLIDQSLDSVDAIATSQLLALRNHVAASIADMDAVFKGNMDTAFDKLSAQQQKLLTDAQVMLYQAQTAMAELETGAFEKASDALCQTTVAFAQLHILPHRRHPPDLLCLSSPRVADAGPFHDQLLQFRGLDLRPNSTYPVVKLRVPATNEVRELISAGGDTILQVPLPGGINGKPNDTSPRGNLIVQADFSWQNGGKKIPNARWLFMLRPYLVSSVNAVITPKLRQYTYRRRTQQFYVEAEKGRESTQNWTITKSGDATQVVDCQWSEFTKVGNSGLMSPVTKTAGACQATGVARGTGGGGGSYGIFMTLVEEVRQELAGPEYRSETQILNGAGETIFRYPISLVPKDSEIVDSNFSWSVYAVKNTGTAFLLTNTQPSRPGQGIATMSVAPAVDLTVHVEP